MCRQNGHDIVQLQGKPFYVKHSANGALGVGQGDSSILETSGQIFLLWFCYPLTHFLLYQPQCTTFLIILGLERRNKIVYVLIRKVANIRMKDPIYRRVPIYCKYSL